MKILFFRETELKNLNPTIMEKQGLAATESCVVCLAQELSKRHTVKVIAPQFKQQFFGNVEYIPFQSYAEVIIHSLCFCPDIFIVAGNPQILIEHPEFLFRCKTIFWQQNHPREIDYRFPIKEILSKTLIVAPSPEAANYYNSHYKTNKIVGIYNGVRDAFFEKNYSPIPNKIIYIGAFSRAKGLSIFLETAKEFPEYNFYCCGDFDLYGFVDKEYKNYCMTKKSQNAYFLGSLNAEQLSKELQTTKICIVNPLINNNETCCVSALEAMVIGTQIIGGSSEILNEIIKHAGTSGITTQNLIQTLKVNKLKTFQDIDFINKLKWSNISQEWEKVFYDY